MTSKGRRRSLKEVKARRSQKNTVMTISRPAAERLWLSRRLRRPADQDGGNGKIVKGSQLAGKADIVGSFDSLQGRLLLKGGSRLSFGPLEHLYAAGGTAAATSAYGDMRNACTAAGFQNAETVRNDHRLPTGIGNSYLG